MIGGKTREVASVLLRTGSTYREVAQALDISVGSVHNIAREEMPFLEPLVAEVKRRFTLKCYLLADHVMSRMSDADFKHASLKEKAIAMAILADKAVQLEGTMPADTGSWEESMPEGVQKPRGLEEHQQEMANETFLRSLFMQGKDELARRMGRIMGMSEEEIEACTDWEDEFDPPRDDEQALEMKELGLLRMDYVRKPTPQEIAERNRRCSEILLEAGIQPGGPKVTPPSRYRTKIHESPEETANRLETTYGAHCDPHPHGGHIGHGGHNEPGPLPPDHPDIVCRKLDRAAGAAQGTGDTPPGPEKEQAMTQEELNKIEQRRRSEDRDFEEEMRKRGRRF